MTSPSELWQNYFNAVRNGNPVEAQQILRKLQAFKGNPHSPGGCSSCNRRFR